jgi:hypothetical protein
MGKDWIGNSRSGMYGLGASNRSKRDREELDFYATPPIATEALLKKLDEVGIKLPTKILEPAVGMGHIASVLKKHGYQVEAADVVDRNWPGTKIQNFLDTESIDCDAIITNPPYAYGAQFVVKAMDLLKDDQYCCMLLKIQFMEGKERGDLLFKSGLNPEWCFVFSGRINCAKQGNFKGDNEVFKAATQGEDISDYDEPEADTGGQIAYAWYVWHKGYEGYTKTVWI